MFTQLTPEALNQFRSLYFTLAADYPHSALLDSCGWEGKTGGFYCMGFEAQETLQLIDQRLLHNGEVVQTIDSKATLWRALAQYFPVENAPEQTTPDLTGFRKGWIGTLGYELNHLLEPTVPYRSCQNPLGDLYFVKFRHLIRWSPGHGDFELVSSDERWVQRITDILAQGGLEQSFSPTSPEMSLKPVQVSLSQEAFAQRVESIQSAIRQGNLYQANLSLRFEQEDVSPTVLPYLYHELVTRNPSPFSGIFWTPEGVVVSNSPERLVKYNTKTNRLETRPIAGTRGRGKTAAEERAIAACLQTDDKEQAEHRMLVDLERNDLGRVAMPGSVQVVELGELERYSHVTHIVSQIEGQKLPNKTAWDILEAFFPGGTITGCPKIRCMETLHHLEPVPRGLYTGSLGYLDVSGNLDFNILIRSLFHWPDNRLHFHAGAGIVADSVPLWEYRECLRKAEVIQGVLSNEPLPNHA